MDPNTKTIWDNNFNFIQLLDCRWLVVHREPHSSRKTSAHFPMKWMLVRYEVEVDLKGFISRAVRRLENKI